MARRKRHMAVFEQAAEEGRRRIKKRQKAEIERQDAAMKERLRQNVQRAKEREARRQLRVLEEAEAAVRVLVHLLDHRPPRSYEAP